MSMQKLTNLLIIFKTRLAKKEKARLEREEKMRLKAQAKAERAAARMAALA